MLAELVKAGKLPPVRVNCNTDMRKHWCELPVELAEQGYLPHGTNAGFAINMEDIFNRGCTYKYAAPGPELMNFMSPGTYHLWVPTNAPLDMSGGVKYFTDPKISPIRWVVWSLGPQPNNPKKLSNKPMSSDTWYRHTGDSGVIVRFADRNGTQFSSQ